MRGGVRGAVGIAWITACSAAGCVIDRGFECERDLQCRNGAHSGVCLQGRCAFEDEDCPSGERYAEHAGSPSGSCVPVEPVTGEGTTTSTDEPTAGTTVSNDTGSASSGTEPPRCEIERVFAARYSSCALTTDAQLWCWGNAEALGRLTTLATQHVPGPIEALEVVDVSGINHVCAMTTDPNKNVSCWGTNGDGQLNAAVEPSSSILPIAMPIDGPAVALGVGNKNTCISDGADVLCWGDVGEDPPSSITVVTDTGAALDGVVEIVGGGGHNCARDEAGAVWCWGSNHQGQLGDGTTFNRAAAEQVVLPGAAVTVRGGGNHTCAVLEDDTVMCWGQNSLGAVGAEAPEDCPWTGDPTIVPCPAPVPTTLAPAQLEVFAHAGCVRSAQGRLECWGNNVSGLMPGVSASMTTPVDLTDEIAVRSGDDSGVIDVALGVEHLCVLTGAGTVWCHGSNAHGQLGASSEEPETSVTVDVMCPSG